MYQRNNNLSKSVEKEIGQKKIFCIADLHKCGICAETFDNRYDKLVHNASHIIIPLPRTRFQKCQLCPKFCTSVRNLKLHMYKGHGLRFDLDCRVVLPRIDYETSVVDRTHSNGVLEVDLYDGVEKHNEFRDEVKAETEFDNDLDIDPVDIDNSFDHSKLELQTQPKPLFKFEDEDDLKKNLNNNNQEDAVPENNFINKIIFEDDVLVYLNTLSVDTITVDDDDDNDDDADIENKEWFANRDEYRNGYQSIITFEDDVENDKTLDEINSFSDSVGYDTLVQPGEFVCRRCGKIYQNRLNLVKHETSHLRWKRPSPSFCKHCDRYIANGPRSLHNHLQRSHPDENCIKKKSKTCTKCGLKYIKYSRHRLNYHTTDKYINDSTDISTVDENDSIETRVCALTKTMDVCELCCMFLKVTHSNYKYIVMGKVGTDRKRACQKCGKECFVLKSVKRVTVSPNGGWKSRKMSLSNKDRLKRIYKRLKNMR